MVSEPPAHVFHRALPLCSCTSFYSADMLNAMQSPYYRYDGSLTTPPCSEGVKWFVSTTTQQVSEAQVQQFILSFRRNARPVQNKNGRTVWSYTF